MNTPRSISERESYREWEGVRYGTLDTAQGAVSFGADADDVRGIWLGQEREANGRLTPVGRDLKKQLSEYFRGRRKTFELPLAFDAPAFTARALSEVEAIPYGETRAYGEVARFIGSPGAARAIGQAVGSNPIPILIPCHRVLAARGRIGGFGGGLDWKRFLLSLESIDWIE